MAAHRESYSTLCKSKQKPLVFSLLGIAAGVSNPNNNAEGCTLGETSIPCRTGGGKPCSRAPLTQGCNLFFFFLFFSFLSHLKPAPLILHTSSDIAQWEGPCRGESCLGSGTGDPPLGFGEGCLYETDKNQWFLYILVSIK